MPTRQLRERVLTHLIHAQVDTFTNYAQGFIDYLKTVEGGLGEFPVEEMSTRTYINRSCLCLRMGLEICDLRACTGREGGRCEKEQRVSASGAASIDCHIGV